MQEHPPPPCQCNEGVSQFVLSTLNHGTSPALSAKDGSLVVRLPSFYKDFTLCSSATKQGAMSMSTGSPPLPNNLALVPK